jgi:hypothetical protein
MTAHQRKQEIDAFARYIASGSDVPFSIWAKYEAELAACRVTRPRRPAPGGWAVAVLVLVCVAVMVAVLLIAAGGPR